MAHVTVSEDASASVASGDCHPDDPADTDTSQKDSTTVTLPSGKYLVKQLAIRQHVAARPTEGPPTSRASVVFEIIRDGVPHLAFKHQSASGNGSETLFEHNEFTVSDLPGEEVSVRITTEVFCNGSASVSSGAWRFCKFPSP